MEKSSTLGTNRTGIQTSPIDIQAMLESSTAPTSASTGSESALGAVRIEYIGAAEGGVGSVPPPGTAKGLLKSGVDMLAGKRPQALVDKIAERLAFERTGTRLYEALIAKFEATAAELPAISRDRLLQFHAEEAAHFAMLVEALQSLGADPTAQTPAADLAGVESQGLLQVVTDPRTTFAQSLHAILVGELADNAGWEMLATVARRAKHRDLADRFAAAHAEERQHLSQVRQWLLDLTLADAGLAADAPRSRSRPGARSGRNADVGNAEPQ